MNKEQACQLADLLGKQNVTLERGLTDEEIGQVEAKYAIRLPPDLRLLLQTALPVSTGFPNWRLSLTSPDEYRETLSQLDWPWEGMVFDMEHGFWLKQWGIKPDNPIFSVYQMDIIYYGMNLANYLSCEFRFDLPDDFIIPEKPKPITFWGPWAEM
jgi:hypothetical protein